MSSAFLMVAACFLSTRLKQISEAREAWRQHKAWGVAQRNPRIAKEKNKTERAKRAAAATLFVVSAVATLRGLMLIDYNESWGFAALHPRGGVPGRASRLGCETLCFHPLRGL